MFRLRYASVLFALIALGAGLGYLFVTALGAPAAVLTEPRAETPAQEEPASPPVSQAEKAAVRMAARAPSGAQGAAVRAGARAAAAGAAAVSAPERDGADRFAPHAAWSAAQYAGVEPVASERLGRVPVLMYHELGDVENGLYVRVQDFAAQLAYLAEAGYHPVTMEDLYRHMVSGRPLPPKPVVISFDDGYRTFWDVAVPLLQKYEYPAIVFVITGLVGNTNYMNWEQVRALPAMGFEVGSHTVTHPDLRRLSGARLQQEVAGSREVLEREIEQQIRFFCYPIGLYNQDVVQAVRDAGYVAAVTTQFGPVTPEQDPMLWSRIRIDRRDTLTTFAKKLAEASQ